MSTFEFQLGFLGELHAGDPVRVKTGLLHLGNSSIRVFHRMFNGRSGELVAEPGPVRRAPGRRRPAADAAAGRAAGAGAGDPDPVERMTRPKE